MHLIRALLVPPSRVPGPRQPHTDTSSPLAWMAVLGCGRRGEDPGGLGSALPVLSPLWEAPGCERVHSALRRSRLVCGRLPSSLQSTRLSLFGVLSRGHREKRALGDSKVMAGVGWGECPSCLTPFTELAVGGRQGDRVAVGMREWREGGRREYCWVL